MKYKEVVMEKCNRLILVAALAFACNGCLTNYYEKYYVDTEGRAKIKSIHGNAPVELRTVTTEDDVLNMIEDGYVSIGYASFNGPYTPMSLAVDTAEKHGAALALLDIRYKETKQYTSVMFLPSTSTSYTYGSVNATAYGPGGTAHAYGNYSGTTTTTTLNAVPVQRNQDIYSHDAMFFKKIDTSNLYGVNWFVPKRLPTEKEDAPIQVRVMAVLHGTPAERDGIKRGQIVKSVNGKLIKTRKDIAPYLNNPGLVKKLEVEDAK